MITKTPSFQTTDGQIFATIELAQRHELIALFAPLNAPPPVLEGIAEAMVAKKDQVSDILSMTPRSKPKARKINGGTKKCAPKQQPSAA